MSIRDFKDVLGRLPEDGQLRTLQVGWANRHWLTCVSEVLGTLFDQDAMQRLGFTASAEGEDRAVQVEDARLFTKLTIRTRSKSRLRWRLPVQLRGTRSMRHALAYGQGFAKTHEARLLEIPPTGVVGYAGGALGPQADDGSSFLDAVLATTALISRQACTYLSCCCSHATKQPGILAALRDV